MDVDPALQHTQSLTSGTQEAVSTAGTASSALGPWLARDLLSDRGEQREIRLILAANLDFLRRNTFKQRTVS